MRFSARRLRTSEQSTGLRPNTRHPPIRPHARDSTSLRSRTTPTPPSKEKNAVSAVPIATKQDQLFLSTREPTSFATQHPTLPSVGENDIGKTHCDSTRTTTSPLQEEYEEGSCVCVRKARHGEEERDNEDRDQMETVRSEVMDDRAVLSPICSPRVRHAQTLFRSPATLSLPPLWVTTAGAEVLARLLRLPAFFQCTVMENPRYRRRVDNALICWVEVLRDPVG